MLRCISYFVFNFKVYCIILYKLSCIKLDTIIYIRFSLCIAHCGIQRFLIIECEAAELYLGLSLILKDILYSIS